MTNENWLQTVFDSIQTLSTCRTFRYETKEDKSKTVLVMDVPGYSKEQVKVSVTQQGNLLIEVDKAKYDFLCKDTDDLAGAEAVVKNGQLTVTIPKKAATANPIRAIPVQ